MKTINFINILYFLHISFHVHNVSCLILSSIYNNFLKNFAKCIKTLPPNKNSLVNLDIQQLKIIYIKHKHILFDILPTIANNTLVESYNIIPKFISKDNINKQYIVFELFSDLIKKKDIHNYFYSINKKYHHKNNKIIEIENDIIKLVDLGYEQTKGWLDSFKNTEN